MNTNQYWLLQDALTKRSYEPWEIVPLPVETEESFNESVLAELDHLPGKLTLATALDMLKHDLKEDSFNSVLDWAAAIRTKTHLSWTVCIELAGIFYYG